MTIGQKVLLARPHPFIVGEMKPLLISAGYTPSPLSDIAEISSGELNGSKGAVISVAVSSVMPESAETVFGALRASIPKLPIVFAGLNDIDVARRTIERLVKQSVANPTVIAVGSNNVREIRSGQTDVFLYIQKDVLKTEEGIETARQMLKRHFS
jgi:hypothetical protein